MEEADALIQQNRLEERLGDAKYVADFQRIAYETSILKGWYEEYRTFGDLISLAHTELSEALEDFRKNGDCTPVSISTSNGGKPEGWGVELADCVIRIMDMMEHRGVSLKEVLRIKMAYNLTRSHRHGGKRL